MATIIASQAMISGTFSIIKQSLSLGCFPRVQVVHKSTKYEGQVFIPEMNYLLMIGCVLVTITFRTTEKISHAYDANILVHGGNNAGHLENQYTSSDFIRAHD
ncbi:potassium transporter 5-like protein [Tanacetum coccineum]